MGGAGKRCQVEKPSSFKAKPVSPKTCRYRNCCPTGDAFAGRLHALFLSFPFVLPAKHYPDDDASLNEGSIMVLRFFSSLSALLLLLLSPVFSAGAQSPVPYNQATVETLYPFPLTMDAALISFDWDATGALHYTVGDPNWGTKLEVYKLNGSVPQQIFASSSVWAGSRLTRLGAYMFFNDGGDFVRSDFNYYGYSASGSEPVFPLLEAPFEASLWGLETRNEGEFFASGSATTWRPGALFYGQMDGAGAFSARPLVQFGEVGNSPGPLCFDAQGTLYYVPGYAFAGGASIYRWTAEEVADALADPVTKSLASDNHLWNTLPAPYEGATGMACDSNGNVYVTATAWGSPSQFLLFNASDASPILVADYAGRLETLRYRDNSLAVSCASGIFSIPLLRVESGTPSQVITGKVGETAVLSVQTRGGIGERHYQWFERSQNKADIVLGDDLSFLALPIEEESGDRAFYCQVSDATGTVTSELFTLVVEKSVPAYTVYGLAVAVLLILAAGWILLQRQLLCGR